MRRRIAFSLLELLMVIAILSLMIGILVPSLRKARELAKDIVCRSNQKNVSNAVILYTEEYEDQYPYSLNRRPIAYDQFRYDLYAPDVHWAVRVGMIPADQMPDYFSPGSSHERIALEGYLEYNWYDRLRGPFKCPSAYDQVNPKPPMIWQVDGTKGAGWGSSFSMNSGLSPWTDEDPTEETDGEISCTRSTDLKRQCVMIGDGTLGPADKYLYIRPTFLVDPDGDLFSFPNRQIENSAEKGFGPWPRLETTNPWSWQAHRCDFEGHVGGSANLCFTDGHVESANKIDKRDWNFH